MSEPRGIVPFFSAIIPLHNKEPYIERAIRSVLNQTYPHLELIIVDDASSDNGPKLAAAFDDSRIRILTREYPGPGGYAARNTGISNAHGEFVAFLDADDWWHPNHLEQMRLLSQEYPEAHLLGCGWNIASENGASRNAYFRAMHRHGSHQISVREYLLQSLLERRPVHTSVACVRKTSPLCPDLFPAETHAKRGGDLHAWLRVMCHHARMAWSSHIGASYSIGVENQVIKSAPATPDLMKKTVYRDLSRDLSPLERNLLARYLNRRLINGWLGNEKRKRVNFRLSRELFWEHEPVICFLFLWLSILPKSLNFWKRRSINAMVCLSEPVVLLCLLHAPNSSRYA